MHMHESFPACHLIHSTVSPGIFYQAIHHLTFFSRTIRLEYMKIPSNSVPRNKCIFSRNGNRHCMAVKKLYLPHVQTLTFIGYNFG